MAFVVEDGTGLENATALASVDDWVAYAVDRGIDISSLDTTEKKEEKLVVATDYINNAFRYKGRKLNSAQSCEFPRTGLYDKNGVLVASDSVPLKVQYATFEYAYRAITEDLWNIPTIDPIGTVKREKVGPLETEYQSTGSTNSATNKYPPGDYYLQEYIAGFGQSYNYR